MSAPDYDHYNKLLEDCEVRFKTEKDRFDYSIRSETNMQLSFQVALAAFKALLILNGAALLALPAFVKAFTLNETLIWHLNFSSLLFIFGLTTNLLAMVCAYFTSKYTQSELDHDLNEIYYKHYKDTVGHAFGHNHRRQIEKFILLNKKDMGKEKCKRMFFEATAIILVFSSLGCFLYGCLEFMRVIV